MTGVETTRGFIAARKVALAVAGSSSRLAAMAGLRLPIESHVLQAFVSEAIKPLVDTVITFGAGHFYLSQSDKGSLVFGGDIDGYNSYAQRGNLPIVEDVCESGMALMPMLGRLRVLRSWGGLMDMSMDGSPIIDTTPVRGALSQLRMVLRGVQGDAGLGPVLRPPDRPQRAACRGRRLPSRPLRHRPPDRREGRRRPAEPALRARVMIEKFAGARGMVGSDFRDLNHASQSMILVSLMIAKFARDAGGKVWRTSQSGH